EAAAEVALLGGVAEAGQADTGAVRTELVEEVMDVLGATDRHDPDALGPEVPARSVRQGLERDLVARAFHQHDRAGIDDRPDRVQMAGEAHVAQATDDRAPRPPDSS